MVSKYIKVCILVFMVLPTFLINAQETVSRSAQDLKRDINSKGLEIIKMSRVKPGMTVLDLLGGGGYYSELLANTVGSEGRVYLHNNKAYMPYVNKELVERLANDRLPNVIRYDREIEDLGVSTAQFDAVFFILGYHDIYHKAQGWDIDKQKLFDQVFPAIKPNGKLVIVDHSALEKSGVKYAQDLHRIDKQYVIDEVSAHGFVLEQESDLLANPDDSRVISPFKPEIRRKTDRFVLLFKKL
ncbi:class I SAM-dependent methyltransferase [Thalassotalea sediminis]|uniref:class I SAM-dependent methyltransferase n=1 Tax=Thalassotalea sediminis TaxID=1759089 RepID=UPI0025734ED3|nr:class I SAM-dependent methyltransferase [Thalassotalea sediminis]